MALSDGRTNPPVGVEAVPRSGAPANAVIEFGHPALALLVTLSGVLVIVGASLRWADWSPAAGQNGSYLSVGAGSSEFELAALGVLVALMGFQVLSRSSVWHYAALSGASLAAALTASYVANERIAAVNKAANVSIGQFCGASSSCGTPDVHAGAGLLLCVSLAILALVCSTSGLVLAVGRRLNLREESSLRS